MSGEKWYKKTWGIILCLILFFPVGLYLMCKYAEWNKGVKTAIMVFFSALVLFSYMGNESTSPTDENRGAAAVVVSTEASTESATKETTTESITKETATETTTEKITEDAESEKSEMVWIPNSGKKYHSNEYFCCNRLF